MFGKSFVDGFAQLRRACRRLTDILHVPHVGIYGYLRAINTTAAGLLLSPAKYFSRCFQYLLNVLCFLYMACDADVGCGIESPVTVL